MGCHFLAGDLILFSETNVHSLSNQKPNQGITGKRKACYAACYIHALLSVEDKFDYQRKTIVKRADEIGMLQVIVIAEVLHYVIKMKIDSELQNTVGTL